MLLQSLRALCLAPGGSGSVWKYLEALVTSPRVSERIVCGFRSALHLADVRNDSRVADEVLIKSRCWCWWISFSSLITCSLV